MQNYDDTGRQYRFETAEHIAKAHAYIAKANTKLAKAGIADRFEVVNEVTGKFEVREGDFPFQTVVMYDFAEFDLNVPSIGHDGWTFVASVSFEEGGTLVNTVPGQDLTGWVRPTAHLCEHCDTIRNRIKSYVLRNDETGEYKQIGSSCLVLFLGVKPALWAVEFEFPAMDSAPSDYVAPSFNRNVWIATSLAVSENGAKFVSKANAQKWECSSTTQVAMDVYNNELRWKSYEEKAQIAADRAEAERILNEEPALIAEVIAAGHRVGLESDYGMNLAVALESETVSYRAIGILTSVVGVYNREQVKEAERKATPQVAGFLGEVKERIKGIKVSVTGVKYIDGMYGTTSLIKFRTEDGHVAAWFASGYKEFELGAELTIDGTVKAKEVYQGTDQTTLTRVTVKV